MASRLFTKTLHGLLERPGVPENFADGWRYENKDTAAIIDWLKQTIASSDQAAVIRTRRPQRKLVSGLYVRPALLWQTVPNI